MPAGETDRKQEAIELVLETVEALFAERTSEEKIWGSMVKQALKRRNPGFNESYYGFRSFSKLLDGTPTVLIDGAEYRVTLTYENAGLSGGATNGRIFGTVQNLDPGRRTFAIGSFTVDQQRELVGEVEPAAVLQTVQVLERAGHVERAL